MLRLAVQTPELSCKHHLLEDKLFLGGSWELKGKAFTEIEWTEENGSVKGEWKQSVELLREQYYNRFAPEKVCKNRISCDSLACFASFF